MAEVSAGTEGAILVSGDADEIVDALLRRARELGIPVVGVEDPPGALPVTVGVVVIEQRDRSDLRIGMAALGVVDDLLADGAIRIVVTASRRTAKLPRSVVNALGEELYYQVVVAVGTGPGERRLRRLRARIGGLILDAAGLHVFRVGRMRR